MSIKGFSLIELLCVFFILSMIFITLPVRIPPKISSIKNFEQTLLLTQMHAMAHKKYTVFPLDNRVRFNASGNVNQAMTIRIDDVSTCTITLGAGRFYVLP